MFQTRSGVRALLVVLISILFVFSQLAVPFSVLGSSRGVAHAQGLDEPIQEEPPAGSEDPVTPPDEPVPDPDPEPDPDPPPPDPDPEPEPDPEPDPGGGQEPSPKIYDVVIVDAVTDEKYAYGTNSGDGVSVKITARGGTHELYSLTDWGPGGMERNTRFVTWASNDHSIATINSAGLIQAVGDGTVEITATVDGAYTETGENLVARIYVEVSGQTNSRYVTSIQITDSEGTPLGLAAYVIEEDISTAQAQFYALVDVHDPATGETTTYDTRNGLLNSQAPDIANLFWYPSDSSRASVLETGLYRPSVYGIVTLYATSSAGLGNTTVSASATVNCADPEGGNAADGYFPQDSLTVKAFYETYRPDEHGDEAYVIDRTFSVGEVSALGSATLTYPALSGGRYMTSTGTGPALTSVLSAAGVNLDGIKQINFGTYDNLNSTLSYAYIVAANRYYFPNIDIGSYAGAQQVYPILALQSNQIINAGTAPDYNMSEATRFRLLFGARSGENSTQHQIKWIHTLYVILEGGPPVEPNDPGTEGGGDGGSSSGDGTGGGTGGGAGGTGAEGGGAALGAAAAGGGSQTPAESTGEAPDTAASEEPGAKTGEEQTASGESSQGSGTGKEFSVLQVMNRNPSELDKPIELENPFEPFALPVAALVFAAGGAEVAVWFRRQSQAISFT